MWFWVVNWRRLGPTSQQTRGANKKISSLRSKQTVKTSKQISKQKEENKEKKENEKEQKKKENEKEKRWKSACTSSAAVCPEGAGGYAI